ncbi:MAG: hypothetical protein RIR26_1956 [Pseudomonadota bacterium]|jgi:hypothetical protein
MKSEGTHSSERRHTAFAVLWVACFLFLALSLHASGSSVHENTLSRISNLQAGDVLLVPLNCYVCNAIEKETGLPYSHSVVVGNAGSSADQIFVYEAWGAGKKTSLPEILERAEKKTRLFHLRPREFANTAAPTAEQLSAVFKKDFANAEFDDEYLWNNTGRNGAEKLYCAEFVVKFINVFLQNQQPPLPMSFSKLNEFWKKYYAQFGMEVPDGEPGASPATLFESERFLKLGELTRNAESR